MSASSFAVGAYRAGEGHLLHRGRLSRPATDRLIVVCHGRSPAAADGCLQWIANASPASGGLHLLELAELGYAVLAIDAGGNLTWANQASEDAVGQAIAWARATGVCHPTKRILLLGYSMGGAVAANYAHNHAADVAGLLLETPGVDLDYLHANGYASEIDAAHPGGYAARNPQAFAGELTMPTRTYAVLDDTVVIPAIPHAFHAALGSPSKTLIDLPNGGHAGFWGGIDRPALHAWVDALSWG